MILEEKNGPRILGTQGIYTGCRDRLVFSDVGGLQRACQVSITISCSGEFGEAHNFAIFCPSA